MKFSRIVSVVLALALVAGANASFAAASGPAPTMSVRFAPGGHYERTETLVHVISYDLSSTVRHLLGRRADPTTILETRQHTLAAKNTDGLVQETSIITRRYGGDRPKSTEVKVSTTQFTGVIAPNAVHSPGPGELGDAGDGALDQLPDSAATIGTKWTFTRAIGVDRDFGGGAMTYKDEIVRIDDRGGHRLAVISVLGSGRIDVARDLQQKGFRTADMTLKGTAEFDLTDHVPGKQHYTAHAQWNTRVLYAHIGLVFDDTYDASPWTPTSHR